MNKNILVGKCKQIRSRVKTWWEKLTDNDLEKIGDRNDKLIGLFQKRYRYTQPQAEDE